MGNFRRLSVWSRAHAFALTIDKATRDFPVIERYGLGAQMRRAAVSIVSNIAEGCGRQSDRELAYFLRIARGSTRELECQLLLARDLDYLRESAWQNLDSECQQVSKMLAGLIATVRRRAKLLPPSS
jgi:four helix bundle protein